MPNGFFEEIGQIFQDPFGQQELAEEQAALNEAARQELLASLGIVGAEAFETLGLEPVEPISFEEFAEQNRDTVLQQLESEMAAEQEALAQIPARFRGTPQITPGNIEQLADQRLQQQFEQATATGAEGVFGPDVIQTPFGPVRRTGEDITARLRERLFERQVPGIAAGAEALRRRAEEQAALRGVPVTTRAADISELAALGQARREAEIFGEQFGAQQRQQAINRLFQTALGTAPVPEAAVSTRAAVTGAALPIIAAAVGGQAGVPLLPQLQPPTQVAQAPVPQPTAFAIQPPQPTGAELFAQTFPTQREQDISI